MVQPAPFASVYQLELKGADLRSLAAAMRGLNLQYRDDLQIKRIYLVSRQPSRGTYRGILELHTTAEKIAQAGLHKIKGSRTAADGRIAEETLPAAGRTIIKRAHPALQPIKKPRSSHE